MAQFGSSKHTFVDIDNDDPLDLVESALRESQDFQEPRNRQFEEDYLAYRSFVEMTGRDNSRAQVFIPKIFEKVEVKSPRQVKALLGTYPFIPLEARRKEYEVAGKQQENVLNRYLEKADFYKNTMMVDKAATLYGTSFSELTPHRQRRIEKLRIPLELFGIQGGVQEMEVPVDVFCLRQTVFMPWEVGVDPYATGLEEKGQCRYAVKYRITTKQSIANIAEFAYPELDLEAFMDDKSSGKIHSGPENIGLEILARLGLPTPTEDASVGVLVRFESETRYVDTWNGLIVLRDIPNPYKHGMINLTRMIHNVAPHTQDQFWGIGEAQPLQVLQSMLNDLNSQAINVHNLVSQPIFKYDPALVDRESIVWEYGNRIPIAQLSTNPDSLQLIDGPQLPAEHYILSDRVERWMDEIASGTGSLQRAEASGGDDTATEITVLKEAGDIRLELNIRNREQIYLKDTARKACSIIGQFANNDDISDMVGPEALFELSGIGLGVDPEELPGGFDFPFQGSNSITNNLVNKRNEIMLYQATQGDPFIRGDIKARWLLQQFDKDPDEIDEAIIPMEIVQLLQQAAQQQSQNGSGLPGSAINTPRNDQEAQGQDSARSIRGQQKVR